MENGNWVPISKAAVTALPNDRPYTKVEAIYSMQVDYDNNKTVSISGYAKLWGWSRDKTRNFIQKVGAEIVYPTNTKKLQNQRGTIKKQIQKQITDRYASEKKQIKFTDNKVSGHSKNRWVPEKKQITDRSDDTTKKTLKTKTKERGKKTPAPENFKVTEKLEFWANKKGFTGNLFKETEKFLDYHRAKGNLYVDWIAAWRNWIRKAIEFQSEKNEPSQKQGRIRTAVETDEYLANL